MKNYLFVILFTVFCYSGIAQSTPEYSSNFAAVVVKNLETSSAWYQSVFKMSVKNSMQDPNGTYKIAILASANFELELLELKGAIRQETIKEGKPANTQIQGLFKVGFKIPNMDGWLKHLASVNVQVPQIWKDQQTQKRNFIITDPDGNLIQFFE